MKTRILNRIVILFFIVFSFSAFLNREAIASMLEDGKLQPRIESEILGTPYNIYLPISTKPHPSIKLSNNPNSVYEFHISPDGEWVVYQSECDVFTVPSNGQSPPKKLSMNGECLIYGGVVIQISPDSSTVAYIASKGTTRQLFRANTDGSGTSTQLSVEVEPGAYVDDFKLSPDSLWVVYSLRGEPWLENDNDLYSVPLDGSSPPIKLNDPTSSSGGIFWGEAFMISPDSTRVVYMADQDFGEKFELYTVPINGSSDSIKLSSPTMQPNGDIRYASYRFTPDSQRVLYTADQEIDETSELYSVPSDGSQEGIKLNSPLTPGSSAGIVDILPDSFWVIYSAGENSANDVQIFRVPIDGSAAPIPLNTPNGLGFVTVTPNHNYLVYQNDGQIFSIGLDPTNNHLPTLLSGNTITETNQYMISLNSQFVVFSVPNQTQLLSVPIDGSSSPQPIATPSLPEKRIADFSISPNSNWVVYIENSPTGNEGLYAVPINGGQLPIKLNGPMIPNGNISPSQFKFEISSQSTWVVYVADQETDGLFELYASLLGYSVEE